MSADPYNKPPWLLLDAGIRSREGERSLNLYVEVMKQFNVLENPRYEAQANKTFCNIFVWDVTRAMGCEIPHWYNDAGGATPVGRGMEMTANKMNDWLFSHGAIHGWDPQDSKAACEEALKGNPTLVIYKNPGGIGHVAMVLPWEDGPHIVQAGVKNLFDVPVHQGFGNLPVTYWSHL